MATPSKTRPVAVDTDPGVDDALALMLALRSPELRICPPPAKPYSGESCPPLLAEGQVLPDTLELANAAAALAVTREGAQPSIPHRDELRHFLATI